MIQTPVYQIQGLDTRHQTNRLCYTFMICDILWLLCWWESSEGFSAKKFYGLSDGQRLGRCWTESLKTLKLSHTHSSRPRISTLAVVRTLNIKALFKPGDVWTAQQVLVWTPSRSNQESITWATFRGGLGHMCPRSNGSVNTSVSWATLMTFTVYLSNIISASNVSFLTSFKFLKFLEGYHKCIKHCGQLGLPKRGQENRLFV